MSFDRKTVADRHSDAPGYSYAGDVAYEGNASVSRFSESLNNARRIALPSGDKGHWTAAVAGRAVDDYTLTPLSRGFIAHWFYEMEKRVYDGDMMSDTLDRPEVDDIDRILDKTSGALGRVRMQGNYYMDNSGAKIRDYGYFSLRRTEDGRWWSGKSDMAAMPYREWSPSELAAEDWKMAGLDDGGGAYPYHEKSAHVKLDPELYVGESGGGGRMSKATEHNGVGDASVILHVGDLGILP